MNDLLIFLYSFSKLTAKVLLTLRSDYAILKHKSVLH